MHTVASFPCSLVMRNDEEGTSISSTRMPPLPVPKPIERSPPSSISIPPMPVVPLHAPPESIQHPPPLTTSFPSAAYPLSETPLPPIGTSLLPLPLIPSTPRVPSSEILDIMPEHIAPLLVIPVGVASQLAKTFGHQQEKIKRRTGIGKSTLTEAEEETFWLSGDYKHVSDVCGCDPRAWRSPSEFCLLLRPAEALNGSNVADVLLPVIRSRSTSGTGTLEEGIKATMLMNPALQKTQEHIDLIVDSGPHIGVMPSKMMIVVINSQEIHQSDNIDCFFSFFRLLTMDNHHRLPISGNIADVSDTERSGIISLRARLSMRNMCLRLRKYISPPSASLGAAFAGKSLWEVSEDEGRVTLAAENNEHKLLLLPSGKEVQNKDGVPPSLPSPNLH